jgi:hypothetical protein
MICFFTSTFAKHTEAQTNQSTLFSSTDLTQKERGERESNDIMVLLG